MDGAFYAFCDVSGLTNDSMAIRAPDAGARRMWRRRPAATSIRSSGDRFMRFSYAGSHEDMVAATDRIGALAGAEPICRA